MLPENTIETKAKVGNLPVFGNGSRLSEITPSFLKYGLYELSFSPQTIEKYKDSIKHAIRDIGDLPVQSLTLPHFTELKQKIIMRGAGDARVASIVFAMKSMLRYCREVLELEVLDYKKIKSPKRRRREVLFLTNEEITQFINVIKIESEWRGKSKKKHPRLDGLRFRTLVEVLLGTGMRISEALSLNRDSINFEKKEAKIIGKGSKERTVFFSQRALDWINYYLAERVDKEAPLFITRLGTRLNKVDVSGLFKRYAVKANIPKKITPHILRHTAATNLLFNGCPISHVKEILGHDRLETTCKYYLGLDKNKAKEAHNKFLNYEI